MILSDSPRNTYNYILIGIWLGNLSEIIQFTNCLLQLLSHPQKYESTWKTTNCIMFYIFCREENANLRPPACSFRWQCNCNTILVGYIISVLMWQTQHHKPLMGDGSNQIRFSTVTGDRFLACGLPTTMLILGAKAMVPEEPSESRPMPYPYYWTSPKWYRVSVNPLLNHGFYRVFT